MAITALLIEFDAATGRRAGNIDIAKHKLRGDRAWQDTSTFPATELRLLPDGTDPRQFEGIRGITVLRGKQRINEVITARFTGKYVREDETIMLEHIRQLNIDLGQFKDKTKVQITKALYDMGVAGIILRQSRTVD